ncbi:I78 family peptidase inhibitor [Paracoccus aerodenitrificans]|uniref:I78 family peptidase inhibitor n=1 Tax=Paracoccus aerodenitrificans TaxID=3017781 RepID=UPI0022F0BA25|nr:I78 family peptidase inhibitor [Paracoccus aerodenitrificans]WBU64978.1 I78 family peptidase inhibitor [Paracoccus aerodenitrificans]
MRQIIPATAVLTVLAACAPPEPGSALPSQCGPEYQDMVGRNIGEFTLPSGLAYRVLQPGAVMTEDMNPARLNIFVDEKGFIQRVTCG